VNTTSRIGRGVVFTLLCLVAVSTVYPLLFMALNTMKSSNAFAINPYSLPRHFSLSSFSQLFSQVPFLAAILHTFFSSLAAFVFTKTPIKFGNVLFWVMLMIMFMPGIVILLPLYVAIAHAGLANNFVPAILIYTALNIPYGTYLLRSNFRSIPDSVVEAARMDGASWMRVFVKVILPIGRPGILTVGILTFLNIWNELFVSLVLLHATNTEMITPTLAQLSGKYSTNVPVLMAGLLLGAVPTLLLYFVSARVFIRGMLSGAVR
jgi:raffinose/stachyose/melibiose transport system permease protein